MSYFGNQGPAQDGGFISGIARGNARLHNARVTRARYQKGIGAVRDYIPMANDFPSDDILYQRAKNFADRFDNAQTTMEALEDNKMTPEEAFDTLDQYKKDRKLIAQWAESGPYVKESKALALGLTPIVAVVAGYYAYRFFTSPMGKVKGHKSALGAVFS